MIIERLAYDGLSERYDVDIFTANQTGQDFSRASAKRGKVGRDQLIRAGSVVDDHLMAQRRRDPLCDGAREDVVAAARRRADQDAHDFRREGLRNCAANGGGQNERDKQSTEMQAHGSHHLS